VEDDILLYQDTGRRSGEEKGKGDGGPRGGEAAEKGEVLPGQG